MAAAIRPARLGDIALAVLGLIGALVPSASAAGKKTITFTGTATFDPGCFNSVNCVGT